VRGLENAVGRDSAARLAVLGRREHECGIRREAVGFERFSVAGEAVTDVLLGEVADKPDPRVAVPDEVLDRGEGPPRLSGRATGASKSSIWVLDSSTTDFPAWRSRCR
jgi:hypothetical protein